MSEALFRYRVRISPKSRSVRLRVTVQHGLEVVVPRGYDEDRIPDLLKRKQHWIEAALERAEANRKFFEPLPAWRLPAQIRLAAIGAVYHVTVRETALPFVVIRELGDDRLLITGSVHDEAAGRAGLGRWLMRQTRRHLVPRLEALSRQTGLAYERVFVKRQRTRWASCSRRRILSLNSKLLFLPHELVGYVLTHELYHVAEMNHSRRFWSLLAGHCPEFRKLDARLRDMWKVVPRWAAEPNATREPVGTGSIGRARARDRRFGGSGMSGGPTRPY